MLIYFGLLCFSGASGLHIFSMRWHGLVAVNVKQLENIKQIYIFHPLGHFKIIIFCVSYFLRLFLLYFWIFWKTFRLFSLFIIFQL